MLLKNAQKPIKAQEMLFDLFLCVISSTNNSISNTGTTVERDKHRFRFFLNQI